MVPETEIPYKRWRVPWSLTAYLCIMDPVT